MNDLHKILKSLNRPRLLIRAARFGLQDYRRDRDLSRVLETPAPSTTESALSALLDAEAEIEEIRVSGDVSYSASRHINLLIAVMAEARLLPSVRPPVF